MFTVATTDRFESDAAEIWTEAEIDELIATIAANPHQGDLIPGTGGLRKQGGHGQARRRKGDHLRNRPAWKSVAVDGLYKSGTG